MKPKTSRAVLHLMRVLAKAPPIANRLPRGELEAWENAVSRCWFAVMRELEASDPDGAFVVHNSLPVVPDEWPPNWRESSHES